MLFDNEYLPYVVVHESIHFQQNNMANDTTLLAAAIKEGMADFVTELITGKNPNYKLHVRTMGKEKQIWADFRKEMYLNRARNWIANGKQETKEKPADLGYWVGYQICKAYYNQASNKKQAVYNMLHIKDYSQFWQQSKIEQTLKAIF